MHEERGVLFIIRGIPRVARDFDLKETFGLVQSAAGLQEAPERCRDAAGNSGMGQMVRISDPRSSLLNRAEPRTTLSTSIPSV